MFFSFVLAPEMDAASNWSYCKAVLFQSAPKTDDGQFDCGTHTIVDGRRSCAEAVKEFLGRDQDSRQNRAPGMYTGNLYMTDAPRRLLPVRCWTYDGQLDCGTVVCRLVLRWSSCVYLYQCRRSGNMLFQPFLIPQQHPVIQPPEHFSKKCSSTRWHATVEMKTILYEH